jgi:hypothetical protein
VLYVDHHAVRGEERREGAGVASDERVTPGMAELLG